MAFAGSTDDSAEDYSAAATVVRFDPPLPLFRAPVPSPASGDGPVVLAFRDAASWRAASPSARLVHDQGAQSAHHANASLPGGKAYL
ncbi:uncharacterized protein [Miscanthus floridulus]|uniref:uncharacterized protein isoform X2 n=1 Tax=Miscanthus floridulus TaxID=154761 RepID=UPI00345A3933